MSACLLDADVVIALSVGEHGRHDRAGDWLAGVEEFALCPVVEGALTRFVMRMGESAATATALLTQIGDHPRSRFWADDVSYGDVDLAGLQGHRQITDAYLPVLAAAHAGKPATFDRGLCARWPDLTVPIP